MDAVISFQVINWEKHQGRKDRDSCSWLKLKHSFFDSPEIISMSANSVIVYVALLCERSKKSTEIVDIHRSRLKFISKMDEKQLSKSLQELTDLNLIMVSSGIQRNPTDDLEKRREEKSREEQNVVPRFPIETSGTALAEFDQFSELFKQRGVTLTQQVVLLKAFPDPTWVTQEIHKAVAWELANPTRRKKNFSAFLHRWFTKSWDQRKTTPIQNTQIKTYTHKDLGYETERNED